MHLFHIAHTVCALSAVNVCSTAVSQTTPNSEFNLFCVNELAESPLTPGLEILSHLMERRKLTLGTQHATGHCRASLMVTYGLSTTLNWIAICRY